MTRIDTIPAAIIFSAQRKERTRLARQ